MAQPTRYHGLSGRALHGQSMPQGAVRATLVLDPSPFAATTNGKGKKHGKHAEQTIIPSYTNLDFISGRVLVRCYKAVDVANIIVKLEGESRSRLLAPPEVGRGKDRSRPVSEYHKMLYRTATVFPPKDVAQGLFGQGSKGAFTLPAGTHEYPFNFKIPFNNQCDQGAAGKQLKFMYIAPDHVRSGLPPTLSGFPGEAQITYYVKVTVTRQSFWKQNPRAYSFFNFFPIEPPRPPATDTEQYARQRHTFPALDPESAPPSRSGKMKSFFTGGSNTPLSPTAESSILADLVVDARLPQPAIITCNTPVPLRLIVKRTTSPPGVLTLESLQISLLAHTNIRAQQVFRTETTSWVLVSHSNMHIPLGHPSDPEGAEAVVDDSFWRSVPLPDDVCPSFHTCNITRTYQLDIRVGLAYGSGRGASLNKKAQHAVILPLRLDVQVFSGIAPPPELLEVMARTRQQHQAAPSRPPNPAVMDAKLSEENAKAKANAAAHASPQSGPAPPAPGLVPTRPSGNEASLDPPPPSYEDAMAGDLPPLSAPRPAYAPPAPSAADDVFESESGKH